VKLRDTLAEAMVLCKDWATLLDTLAEAKERDKDWVQALCTLAVETLHDTCCFGLPEGPVRSLGLVWENLRAVLRYVCSHAFPCSPVRWLEEQARAS
jgi:hypothetical protein